MKKKMIHYSGAAIIIVITFLLAFNVFFNTKLIAHSAFDTDSLASSEDDNWNVVTNGEVVLENDNTLLRFEVSTTHFTVINKNGGTTFNSIPNENITSVPSGDISKLSSEMSISYYDSDSMESTMFSSANSVSFNAYEVKTDGKAVRVYYTFKKTETKTFVPVAFTQESFEQKILENLSSGQQRRLKLYYKLYDSGDTDSETKSMKEKHPCLNDTSMYVIYDGLSELNYQEVTQCMADASYTQDDYLVDAKELGLSDSALSLPAEFIVPVEYSLTNDGFVAKILSDKIKTISTLYTLTNVSLLEYLGSKKECDGGYILVPDGSGAIIDLAEKAGSTYIQNVYGLDLAVNRVKSAQIAQNATIPIFGFNRVDSGFLAIIIGAAEEASINAAVYGNSNLQSHAFARFNLRGMDSTDIGQTSNIPVFNLYANHIVYENPQVRYVLFDQGNATYSQMANYYRNYLIETGVLKQRLEETDNIPVYIDFTGYTTTDSSLLVS